TSGGGQRGKGVLEPVSTRRQPTGAMHQGDGGTFSFRQPQPGLGDGGAIVLVSVYRAP
ncbi:hypothetical protein E2562_031830, partial [Oryza meyeriana var. granulata]